MIKTTVLIPNYNGIKFLEKCLNSIKEAGEYHVIIVDNGSVDGSVEYIKENFPQMRLIQLHENTGFCHAVNVGLKEIDTEYVFLLNNDTEICCDTISKLEIVMDSEEKIFSAQSRILSMYDHDIADDCGDLYCALGWAFARGKNKASDIYMKPADIFAGCGAAVMYRMSLLEDIGKFDEKHFAYLEDIDLGYRARIFGYRNVYEPSSVVYHAGSATSGSRYNRFKVNLSAKNSIYLIYKNMPLVQIILNLPFLLIGYLIKTIFFILKGMGFTYLRGIIRGFKMCFVDLGSDRRRKVFFTFKHLPVYIKIQLELWENMVKRFH